MGKYTILLICVFFAIFTIFCDVFVAAQPPSGRRPRGEYSGSGRFGGARTRPFPPRTGAPGVPNSPNSPVGVPDIGTVPDFSDLNDDEPLDARPFLDRATVSQPLSAKLLRYTEHLISKYDTNGNGQLELDEWHGKMSGSPQVIDLNGDNILTIDEFANHIEKFSRWRTIHNPYPLQQLIANRVIPVQEKTESLFRPLSKNISDVKRLDFDTSGETKNFQNIPKPDNQVTDEEIELGQTAISENSTETKPENSISANAEIAEQSHSANSESVGNTLTGKIPPSQTRKYSAPTQGLPAWFVRCDLDGDGQVSLYEFAAPNFTNESVARFGRLDKNGDGFITGNELR